MILALLSLFFLPALIVLFYPPLSLLPTLPVSQLSVRITLQSLTYIYGIYTSRLTTALTLLILSLRFGIITKPDMLQEFVSKTTEGQSPEIVEAMFLSWLAFTIGLMSLVTRRKSPKKRSKSVKKDNEVDESLKSLKKIKKVLGSEAELAAMASNAKYSTNKKEMTKTESKLEKAKREAKEEQARRVEETLRKRK
ncbi:hypothetical protein TrLO_g1340 [Triparma laevis f. longispina]|uniref:Uncharacterized protein n=1 Tax=Triparma laevis f. longispina TaxID=1714387 RepID=A0A9W7FNZ9_9STRA|nr:hypothetical protein TrLO_g1340 [Triparma laevis f. longispina]